MLRTYLEQKGKQIIRKLPDAEYLDERHVERYAASKSKWRVRSRTSRDGSPEKYP